VALCFVSFLGLEYQRLAFVRTSVGVFNRKDLVMPSSQENNIYSDINELQDVAELLINSVMLTVRRLNELEEYVQGPQDSPPKDVVEEFDRNYARQMGIPLEEAIGDRLAADLFGITYKNAGTV
jgi:hypothetical protein